ncbi:MAG TPA: hypothetical protein VNL74_09550 [Methylococcus sp.]|nr:hypothetical protein [Methylococcus sp.]
MWTHAVRRPVPPLAYFPPSPPRPPTPSFRAARRRAGSAARRRLATSRLNFEITAWVMDPAFAAWMAAMFVTDFERSRLMNQADLIDRPWWLRVGSRAAYLLAPVL